MGKTMEYSSFSTDLSTTINILKKEKSLIPLRSGVKLLLLRVNNLSATNRNEKNNTFNKFYKLEKIKYAKKLILFVCLIFVA